VSARPQVLAHLIWPVDLPVSPAFRKSSAIFTRTLDIPTQGRLLPAVPNGLTASAADVAAYHHQIKQVATDAIAFACDVQEKVGASLAALQIGDITRQRIEHAQKALDHLAAVDRLAPLSAVYRPALNR
jgi:hypothetical protein